MSTSQPQSGDTISVPGGTITITYTDDGGSHGYFTPDNSPAYSAPAPTETTTLTPSYDYSSHSDSPSYTPYVPPKPAAPAAPPAAPPEPGPTPTFTYDARQQLVKYEYMYGVKDIQIRGNEFAQTNIYVSKPILVTGNVMEVSLTASEEHPVFSSVGGDATDRQTSVEYYIAYTENPSLEEWHPILPEDQTSIRSELLIFDSARTATLRFPALAAGATVYQDGIVYTSWSFTGGGMKVQLLAERKPGSVYTIDYTPNAEITNPWLLDIYSNGLIRMKVTEQFPNGTDHNKTITLSDYPYIDYSQINTVSSFNPNVGSYKPIQVSILNANIAGPSRTTLTQIDPYSGATQTAYTYNITDYKTKAWQIPAAYSLDKTAPQPAFQYWHQGNKVYFSETFNKADILSNQDVNHGDGTVSITYEKLVANFRVKMILRRNGSAATSVSPIVYQYGLKFKAVK